MRMINLFTIQELGFSFGILNLLISALVSFLKTFQASAKNLPISCTSKMKSEMVSYDRGKKSCFFFGFFSRTFF